MKKMFKVLVTTAALATIIPISAFAADAVSPSPTPIQNAGKDGAKYERHWAGKGGFLQKKISEDLLGKLKLDKQALQDKLAAGKTLAQIAAEQGLSRAELKALLTADYNKALEQKKTEFAANLDDFVDGKGFKGGRSGQGFHH